MLGFAPIGGAPLGTTGQRFQIVTGIAAASSTALGVGLVLPPRRQQFRVPPSDPPVTA